MNKKDKKFNIIFLGRKASALEALSYLLTQKRAVIKLIVAPPGEDYGNKLEKLAAKFKIPVLNNDDELYKLIIKKDKLVSEIDLVISYLYWRKIRQPLYTLPKFGCVNFHPALLPDYKGRAGYNTAILDQKKYFGVSAHFINSEMLDSGPIIKVRKFFIKANEETAFSLERKTQQELFMLFKQVMGDLLSQKKVKTKKNQGGAYLNKEQLEKLKEINLKRDSLDEIHRKIRAFFFPPHSGATIEIKREKFTLIDKKILELINDLIKNK